MVKRGMQPMHDDHVNVTPLIDVVMCLIIFFLVCGQLARGESVKGVHVPIAKHAQDMAIKKHELIVNLVPHKPLDYRDQPTIVVFQQDVLPDKLVQLMRQEKRLDPRTKLVLRADAHLPYKFIAPVLEDATEAGITNVNFMTRR